MFINHYQLPEFVCSQVSHFFKAILGDFDSRYPEVRERRILEFQIVTGREPQLDVQIEKRRRMSLFDWSELMEWNERLDHELSRNQVSALLNDSQVRAESSSSKVVQIVLQRLQEIDVLLTQYKLSQEPHLLELLIQRWNYAILRQEIEFLISLLRKYRPKIEPETYFE